MTDVIHLDPARRNQSEVLSTNEKRTFESLKESYPKKGSIHRIQGFSNLSTHNDDVGPQGLVVSYALDVPVKVDSLGDNTFEYMAIAPVRLLPSSSDDSFVDSDFDTTEYRQRLNEAVPQYSEASPSLKFRDHTNNSDDKHWAAELGESPGAFVGIYASLRPNGREKDYYIIARAGAPLAARELRNELLAGKKGITFGELLENPRVAYVKDVARRNVERLVAQAASAVCKEIGTIPDFSAYSRSGICESKPFISRDHTLQATNTIERIYHDGKPYVAVFQDVTPAETAGEQVFITAGPYDGVFAFPIGNVRGEHGGFPTSTGQKDPNSRSKQMGGDSVLQKRARQAMWEGKVQGEKVHRDLHPEAYHPMNREFENSLVKLGWNRADKSTRLIPVLLKLSNPDLKRP
jgi:hypothetical protein